MRPLSPLSSAAVLGPVTEGGRRCVVRLRLPSASPPVQRAHCSVPASRRQSVPRSPLSPPSPSSSSAPSHSLQRLTFPRPPLSPLVLHQWVDCTAQSKAGTGCLVWPLSLRLSSFLCAAFSRLSSPPVLLDVSGGCGYLGLSLSPLTSSTTISDRPVLLPLLRLNRRLNSAPTLPPVHVAPLLWDASPSTVRAFVERYPLPSVVTACDLHYLGVDHRHSSLPSLHLSLSRLLLTLSSLITERTGGPLTLYWAMEDRGPMDDAACAPLYKQLTLGGMDVSAPLTADDGWHGEATQTLRRLTYRHTVQREGQSDAFTV